MTPREPSHPGVILKEEFLDQYGLTAADLAVALKLSLPIVLKLINKDYDIGLGIALRLSRFFGTTPEFWISLQSAYTHWEVSSNEVYQDMLKSIPTVADYIAAKGDQK